MKVDDIHTIMLGLIIGLVLGLSLNMRDLKKDIATHCTAQQHTAEGGK